MHFNLNKCGIGEKNTKLGSNIYLRWKQLYLIIKAAATFRTLGHFSRATTVNAFPKIPTIMMAMVKTAAMVNSHRGNLK